jgi:hypothetical protein
LGWAVENGLTDGSNPAGEVTREQLAALLYRYAGLKGLALPETAPQLTFADDSEIADYTREAVYALRRAGIISGKPEKRFDPQGLATRAEVAAILKNFLEALDV